MKDKMILAAALVCVLSSCSDWLFPEKQGDLTLAFSKPEFKAAKSGYALPDTNDFILKVTTSDGAAIYEGKYGNAPGTLMVDPGTYTVSVKSEDFSEPKFSAPQFGDEQVVVVPSGGSSAVRLQCRQINCGVRLNISPDFLTYCPDAVLFLKSAEGKLMYSYSEKRAAYFKPGMVSLVKSQGASDEVIFSREMAPCEMLMLNLTVPAGSQAPALSISIDTTRVWTVVDHVLGTGETTEILNVPEARGMAGSSGVKVKGYIVGGDLTSSKASFKGPFTSRTNIMIASRSGETDRDACMSVQLEKGAIRDALNLVDHPGLLGRQVVLTGDIVASYYGLPGIQNLTDYKLD